MTPTERADAYSEMFPDYPPLRADDRWLDGVWVLGNNYRGSGFYGAYPPQYVRRVLSLFPDAHRLLHLFSGSLPPAEWGVTVDRVIRGEGRPMVQADAYALPFASATFDLVLADPPYSALDATRYGTPMINRRTVLREAARVTTVGGNLVWLDTVGPMFSKRDWHWWGIVAVHRSMNHRVRAAFMFRRLAPAPAGEEAGR